MAAPASSTREFCPLRKKPDQELGSALGFAVIAFCSCDPSSGTPASGDRVVEHREIGFAPAPPCQVPAEEARLVERREHASHETLTEAPAGVVRCGSRWHRTASVPCAPYVGSDCMSDGDCPDDHVCLCAMGVRTGSLSYDAIGRPGNRCVRADCPGDCGGLGCGISLDTTVTIEALHCHTQRDACDVEVERCNGCAYDETEARWTCQELPMP